MKRLVAVAVFTEAARKFYRCKGLLEKGLGEVTEDNEDDFLSLLEEAEVLGARLAACVAGKDLDNTVI